MDIYEFLLALLAMIIMGIWGLLIISHKCGLLDKSDLEDKKKKKSEK